MAITCPLVNIVEINNVKNDVNWDIKDSIWYYEDKATHVMYMKCNTGLTVMLDPETGKPLTRERYEYFCKKNKGE